MNESEKIATNPTHIGLRHIQDSIGRDRRIDRIPARPQDR
jgi:hypothetical protein